MRTLEISVVEDNPADVEWLELVLEEVRLPHHLTIAHDGEEAVECLTRRGRYADSPVPDLILLDMHLPKFGGLEILRRVPQAKELPICILSSTDQEKGLVKAYFDKPVCYLVKPISSEMLWDAIHQATSLPDGELHN